MSAPRLDQPFDVDLAGTTEFADEFASVFYDPKDGAHRDRPLPHASPAAGSYRNRNRAKFRVLFP